MTDLEAGLSATGDTNDAAHLTSKRRTEAEAERWPQIKPKAFLLPSFLPRLAAVNKTCREQLAVIFISLFKISSAGEHRMLS